MHQDITDEARRRFYERHVTRDPDGKPVFPLPFASKSAANVVPMHGEPEKVVRIRKGNGRG